MSDAEQSPDPHPFPLDLIRQQIITALGAADAAERASHATLGRAMLAFNAALDDETRERRRVASKLAAMGGLGVAVAGAVLDGSIDDLNRRVDGEPGPARPAIPAPLPRSFREST